MVKCFNERQLLTAARAIHQPPRTESYAWKCCLAIYIAVQKDIFVEVTQGHDFNFALKEGHSRLLSFFLWKKLLASDKFKPPHPGGKPQPLSYQSRPARD